MSLTRGARDLAIGLAATFSAGCFNPDSANRDPTEGSLGTTTSNDATASAGGSSGPEVTSAPEAEPEGGTSGEASSAAPDETTIASGQPSGGGSSDEGDPSEGDPSEGDPSEGGPSEENPSQLIAVDDHYLVAQGERLATTPLTGLVANDHSRTALALFATVGSSTSEAGGAIDVSPDGSFTYVPPSASYWGTDGFTYRVTDEEGNVDHGHVTIAVRPRTVLLSELSENRAGFVLAEAATGGWVGSSSAAAGDMNGDGLADLLVGAYLSSWRAHTSGRAYVVFGTEDVPSSIELESILDGVRGFAVDGEASESVGKPLSGLGDINGDGYDDAVVGAPRARLEDRHNVGRCYVLFGAANVPDMPIDFASLVNGRASGFVLEGGAGTDALCEAAAAAGDFNGDAIVDAVFAAPGVDANGDEPLIDVGRTYLLFGAGNQSAGLENVESAVEGGRGIIISGENVAYGRSGESLSGVGDFNGDGLDDLAVGAPSMGDWRGRVYLLFGSRSLGSHIALQDIATGSGGVAWDGVEENERAGISVSGVGDFNGDGLSDLVIGAFRAPFESTANAGRAYVVFGSREPSESASLDMVAGGRGGFVVQSDEEYAHLGEFSVGLGDVNGDGLDDLAIGGYGSDAVYVVFGTREELPSPLLADELAEAGYGIRIDMDGNMTRTLSAAGDLNDDGLQDLVIGTHQRAQVMLGHAFTNRPVLRGERLIGTGAEETLIGTAGDDVFSSSGGFDVIYSGRGDDEINLGEGTFFRIDGGPGVDTVRLLGANLRLDLTLLPASSFRGVERIDISGTGENYARVDVRTLVNLAGQTLTVVGDEDDEVELDLRGAGFSVGGTRDAFRIFSNGRITVRVSVDARLHTLL